MRRPFLISALLLAGCFTLAVTVEPKLAYLPIYNRQNDSPLKLLLGDGRKFFANHFFVKADAYFHSGYYPSIFDNREAFQTAHVAADACALEEKNTGDGHVFLGESRDIIERFGRAFFPSEHTHLDEGGAVCHHDHDHEHAHGDTHDHHNGDLADDHSDPGVVREILPWLRLSAELDPQRIETYMVGSYWLRSRMGKVAEAEAFLRNGLKANPGHYAILFELGRVFFEHRKDLERARNVWASALTRWLKSEAAGEKPDPFLLLQIATHLARLEEQAGQPEQAIACLKIAKSVSPSPDKMQAMIEELGARAVPKGQ